MALNLKLTKEIRMKFIMLTTQVGLMMALGQISNVQAVITLLEECLTILKRADEMTPETPNVVKFADAD